MIWIALERLVLATLLGLLVGVERHLKKRPAGMRTHALVALGTCMFALFGTSLLGNNPTGAPNYVIPAIISGIGFLGAGLIFGGKDGASGLTTAAEVWALAAVGILVGIGQYVLAISATALILIILVPVRWIENKIGS